ncbi:MAG: molybdenum cofactor biosynthesis protein [Cellulomonas sp. 73-92]|uniref:MogA/MoaB family molybdenum cofactor biosynthesis protein n=1 Tax=Cellulomonas sp. 73-92 TaxID=1895740 RepID=UPI000925C653|nr:MogA/MoaB family molybdenum cofactor biosynthesis protein [Cellulomonas sp. 73-92]OJV76453.1 MAG: molybdenum cofactor biosynthesis protein [Cellulomonas sp. 73-92]
MSHAHGGAARVVVVTVSDRCAAGERVDESGPAAADAVRAAGLVVRSSTVVPDGVVPVRDALRDAIAAGADVILTLGGTGVGPRDRTPEATREVIEMELPGIAEAIRANGRRTTPTAALSRGVAGCFGDTLVVNLPGSPAAVREALEVLLPLVPHVVDQLRGGDH